MGKSTLDYFLITEDDSIERFKKLLQQEVNTLYVDIALGKMNDADKSKHYAEKLEKVLALPYFNKKEYLSKTVGWLKEKVKIDTLIAKTTKEFLSTYFDDKRERKLEFTQKYVKNSKLKVFSDVQTGMLRYYNAEIKYFNTKKEEFVLERDVNDTLLWFTKVYKDEINNQWKGKKFKEFLTEKLSNANSEKAFSDLSATNKSEKVQHLEYALSNLPYFKYKKYLVQSTAADIKNEFNKVSAKTTHMLVLIEKYISYYKEKKSNEKFEYSDSVDAVCSLYNTEFAELSEKIANVSKEYSLYRFFQGVIEADIFKSLYE